MRKFIISIIAILIIIIYLPNSARAQHYKLKQVSNMMGMKSESTIYVKGMRKRTEGGGMMGMGANLVTIEQCDLQRTIKLNDKKKLYFIEPFAQGNEEVVDEENGKNVTPSKQNNIANQKGGVINMWYNITDTGERKKMFGMTARHVWTSQKIKPSPDACSMKDSMLMKTDGWYIDLPQFNCPVHYRPARMTRPNEKVQPDCKDRFITHRRGKGKLGFPLTETSTIIMGGGSTMQTSIETLEFSTTKLDSMLFEIPPGYELASSEDQLQNKMDMKEMMKGMNRNNENTDMVNKDVKKPGTIRIGVFAPSGNDQVQAAMLQQHIVGTLSNGNVEGVAVSNEDEARKLNCDYTLSSVFTNIKSAGNKLGGLLKAIKNADPNAASSFNIQANLTLKALSDGSVRSQPSVDGKYEGKIDDAAGKALDDGCRVALKALK
jgi:hypothetical protein